MKNNMQRIQEFNLMDNSKLILRLNIYALFLTIAFIISGIVLIEGMVYHFKWWLFPGFIILILMHEGIHGVFFKLLNKEAKVKYGYQNGLAYATSPNTLYSKRAFIQIIGAPFVLISINIFIFVVMGLLDVWSGWLLFSLHGGSCIGDFYMTWLLLRQNGDIYVMDTEKGMDLYRN